MSTKSPINVRGSIRKMQVNEVLEFPRAECKPLSVRTMASQIKENYGSAYSVSAKDPDKVVVKRIN
jgi:hypothetical protein